MNKQPIGYLVRWLQCGCNHDGQQEHFGARNLTGDDQELSYEECKRARDWIRTAGVEDVDSLFAAEPGDGEEPLPRARAGELEGVVEGPRSRARRLWKRGRAGSAKLL